MAIVIRYIIFSGSEGVEALLAPHVGGIIVWLSYFEQHTMLT